MGLEKSNTELRQVDYDLPSISIVTPVRNAAKWVEQAITSVVDQKYPGLEYIVIDGASDDGTLDIIRRYSDRIHFWMSEPDRNLYDALNKGFKRCSANIMGWINGTAMLQENSLKKIVTIFNEYPEVEWITGRTTLLDLEGKVTWEQLPRWSRLRFLAGANQYIQQESTFWRRSLWDKSGGKVDDSTRNAGDFKLWLKFFEHSKIYSVDTALGGYRERIDALSTKYAEEYDESCEEAIETYIRDHRFPGRRKIRFVRYISKQMQKNPLLRKYWKEKILKCLYKKPFIDFAPVIRTDENGHWKMYKR